jgi:hypothetical protein
MFENHFCQSSPKKKSENKKKTARVTLASTPIRLLAFVRRERTSRTPALFVVVGATTPILATATRCVFRGFSDRHGGNSARLEAVKHDHASGGVFEPTT